MKLLVDVHSHLDHKAFEKDLPDVIERAKDAGLSAIITAGINPETNRKTLEICEKYKQVKPALGVYPVSALKKEADIGEFPIKVAEFDFDEELEFIKKNKDRIIAVGEIGLDFLHDKEQHIEQKENFIALLELAEKIRKPVFVHSRKAEAEAIEILKSRSQKKVIMHCFSGNFKLIKQGIEQGFYFSIPTNVVFSSHFQELSKMAPACQLFTETDAPYLSPAKGERNEPANIAVSVRKIAELKGLDADETSKLMYENYQRVFL
jgi:TatD DNase family protein